MEKILQRLLGASQLFGVGFFIIGVRLLCSNFIIIVRKHLNCCYYSAGFLDF